PLRTRAGGDARAGARGRVVGGWGGPARPLRRDSGGRAGPRLRAPRARAGPGTAAPPRAAPLVLGARALRPLLVPVLRRTGRGSARAPWNRPGWGGPGCDGDRRRRAPPARGR